MQNSTVSHLTDEILESDEDILKALQRGGFYPLIRIIDLMSTSQRDFDDQQNATWEPCPAGALSDMVGRLDASQRSVHRRQVLQTALASTVAFACLVLVVGSLYSGNDAHYGGITCSYCRNHFDVYALHLQGNEELSDAKLVESMQTHLAKCSFCQDKFKATFPGVYSLGNPISPLQLERARQPMFAMSVSATRH